MGDAAILPKAPAWEYVSNDKTLTCDRGISRREDQQGVLLERPAEL
jgi:hypothetical protein